MNKYKYRFRKGFDIIEEGEAVMKYIRYRGKELAKMKGEPITHECFNEPLCKWQNLGASRPDGLFINGYGQLCKLEDDCRNYSLVKD